ncbi:hypothetical protein D3C72_2452070 [compost metagenome]
MPAVGVQLLDQDPHDLPEGLGSLELDQHVSQGFGELVFLGLAEDAFDELHVHERHGVLLPRVFTN